jgi:hypothetical protein
MARARHPRDTRLPDREEVAGLTLDGQTRAYPLSVLARRRVVQDVVGGRRVKLEYEAAADRVRAFTLDGDAAPAPLPAKRELWISWAEFNPRTGVYAG